MFHLEFWLHPLAEQYRGDATPLEKELGEYSNHPLIFGGLAIPNPSIPDLEEILIADITVELLSNSADVVIELHVVFTLQLGKELADELAALP